MYGNRQYLEEAIADAKRMLVPGGKGCCVVTRPHGQYRAVRRHIHIKPERIMWQSWEDKSPGLQDKPEYRQAAVSLRRMYAIRAIGCTPAQFDYAANKYGWPLYQKPGSVSEEELRKAMKVMTAREFAKVRGCNPARIYTLCRQYGIARGVRNGVGKRIK